jgi:excisionase family DNA binding protein
MRLYSTTEAAKLLGLTRKTVFCWIKAGKITAQRSGRSFVIVESDLKKFLKKPSAVESTETAEQKERDINETVKRVVNEYGDTLRKLGAE